ncbi:MAG: NAD-dependent epimerase/dehydratase family protein, partial [Candidatus Kariarchaeaceae archaeon]
MSTLLITGATGFLGSYILKELETPRFRETLDFETIRFLVRSPEKAVDLKSDFYAYETIKGDLFDHKSIEKAATGVDAIIHIAALFDASSKKEEFEKANVLGTQVLINSLKSGSKFILTSSTGVYGFPNQKEPLAEDYEPKKPYWHYQKSKKNQEDLAFELCP